MGLLNTIVVLTFFSFAHSLRVFDSLSRNHHVANAFPNRAGVAGVLDGAGDCE